MSDAKISQTITADSLKNTNNSTNFTYSMWLYVDDWNYMYGQPKTILSRAAGPDVILGEGENTLQVNIAYYGTDSTAPSGPKSIDTSNVAKNAANAAACQAADNGFSCAANACDPALYDATYNKGPLPTLKTLTPSGPLAAAAAAKANISTCKIDNLPIQTWVNVIISLYGSTLDMYLDGKLVRTCVLPGVPKIDNTANINVTPNGGFSGWTTSFKYWANASNPQQAYNIYKDGYGGSILANALNKYRVQFSLIKDNKEAGSFQI